jgi:hypothetical protein
VTPGRTIVGGDGQGCLYIVRALFQKVEGSGDKTFWKWEASGKDASEPAFPVISRVITKSEPGFEAC